MEKRIAITGSAGFLGRASIEALSNAKSTESITGIDLLPTPKPTFGRMNFVSERRDIREDMGDTLRSMDADCVIHLAFHMPGSRNRNSAYSVNVEGIKTTLESCRNTSVHKFFYISSTSVYGAYANCHKLYSENEEPRPLKGFPYSEHKMRAEQICMEFAEKESNFSLCILRICIVMGPAARNFMTPILSKAALPADLYLNPQLQILHIDDYKSALLAAISKSAEGIYNIASRDYMNWRDIIKTTGGHVIPLPSPLLNLGVEAAWMLRLQNFSQTRGIDLIRYPWNVSIEKAEKDLGWQPKYGAVNALKSWNEYTQYNKD